LTRMRIVGTSSPKEKGKKEIHNINDFK
jgi:hypothetical protein